MTWTDTEAALWELKAMGIGPKHVWRDPDGHVRGDVYGATADEMKRIADLLESLDAGRAPLPKGPAGPARFETLNSYEDEKRVWAWLLDGAQGLKMTSLDRLVLVSLARHANSKTGEAWPGDETLAALADVHVGSVDRSLGRLRKAGLIASRPGGRNHRARHTLVGPIAQPVGEAIDTDSSTQKAHSSTPQLDSSTHELTGSRRNKEKQGKKEAAAASKKAAASFSSNGFATKTMERICEATEMKPEQASVWADIRVDEHETRTGEKVADADAYIIDCLERLDPAEISYIRATTLGPGADRVSVQERIEAVSEHYEAAR